MHSSNAQNVKKVFCAKMNNGRKRHWNGKFDSFLQRSLTGEAYERIYTWEPCVISSSEEKLVHKYVVLSNNCVYLVDFNLKTAPKLAFLIKNVAEIRKLDDIAQFLSGKERDEAVHVQIHYDKKVVGVSEKGGVDSWSSAEWSPRILDKLKSKMSFKLSPPNKRRASGDISPIPSSSSAATSQPGSIFHPKARVTKSLSPGNIPLGVSLSPRDQRNVTFDSTSSKPEPQSLVESDLDASSTHSLEVVNYKRQPKKRAEFAESRRWSKSANALDMSVVQKAISSISADNKSESVTSVNSNTSCESEESFVAKNKSTTTIRSSTMDLYILRKETDFYCQINTTWNCWKISATIQEHSPKLPHKSREYVSQLFYQVKHELLATKKMESLAKLFMELNSASQKHSIINKLFWDSSELLELCIHEMSSYLHPQAPHEDVSDVMEYCIIILELLYHVLQESFMCHCRLEVLFQHRGQLTLSLLDLLTRSTLINSTSNSEEKCLKAELSDKVYCVLSELLKAAQQLRFYHDIGKHVGLTWLVEHIYSTEMKGKGTIVKDLIGHYSLVMKIPGPLAATNAVIVYHMVHILNVLCLNSPKFVTFFCTELMDDIRHLLRFSTLEHKLPVRYPITRNTLELFRSLLHSLQSHSP